MPELPEVQTVVDTLAPHVRGAIIRRAELFRSDICTPATLDLAQRLAGRSVTDLTRRGKRIVFSLNDCNRFYIHLGMSGSLTALSDDAPRLPHTHLILQFDRCQIRFTDPRRFGGIFWMGKDLHCEAGLGPEPLEVRTPELARRLGRTTRAIKTALLDQSILAGVGNIYADEALFAARIHPRTKASRISAEQARKLNIAIKQVLRRAIQHRGSTLRSYRDANGESGAFQKLHRVYGRAEQPCCVCKSLIARIVLGGRSTHFCPKCQAKALRS